MSARKYIPVTLLLLCVINAATRPTEGRQTPPARHSLMPVPAAVRFGPGRLAVDKSFTVAAPGHSDERLSAGIDRAVRRLERRTVIEMARGLAPDAAAATLVVQCGGPGRAVPSVEEDESYTLEVTDRQAVLRAPTVVGALRGLETFLQLLEGDRAGHFIPAVQIQD